MCISFYCDVVFTHLYLISWWVPPLYFPFQVDSRARTKSRKQNHLEGHNASLPRRPSSWPEVMAKHNQTCFKPMLICEPLYHVKACSNTSECLQLRRSKWPDVRKTTTKQTRRTFNRKEYHKRKNPGTVPPYQSCQDKQKRGADELRPQSWAPCTFSSQMTGFKLWHCPVLSNIHPGKQQGERSISSIMLNSF